MACQSCAERRARMKQWLTQKAEQAAKWAKVRGTDAKPSTRTSTRKAKGAKRRARAKVAEGE